MNATIALKFAAGIVKTGGDNEEFLILKKNQKDLTLLTAS